MSFNTISMNGPIPFKKRNYPNTNAVLVLPGDIPRNAAILIFLYVTYFSIKKTMVNFTLVSLVYFSTSTFRNLTEKVIFTWLNIFCF